jgi:hypothetical protein
MPANIAHLLICNKAVKALEDGGGRVHRAGLVLLRKPVGGAKKPPLRGDERRNRKRRQELFRYLGPLTRDEALNNATSIITFAGGCRPPSVP